MSHRPLTNTSSLKIAAAYCPSLRRGGEEESAKSALNRFQKFAQLTDERGDLDAETANQMQFPRYGLARGHPT
jgi:hypothetical protein